MGILAADGNGDFDGRTLTGLNTFIAVTNGDGIAGNPVISIDEEFETTGMHGWNGAVLEDVSVSASSDGATITFSVEKNGGGDLTTVFSDGYYTWDTTPADTVVLTAGTNTVPVLNYVYFLQSTKTLTVSTVSFPASEYVPLATVLCPSAALYQTDGAYKFHAWTDHVVKITEQGHISDINYWIRNQQATWVSGVGQTFVITTNAGIPDNVNLTTIAGVVLQLHNHTFPAFAATPDFYVVNDSVTPYTKVTDLNALLTDSTGASMAGRYFSLVIWGVVSEDTGDCKLMVNLPGGSYNGSSNLRADSSRFINYSIPQEFVGTGFLIAQWGLRHQAASGGTWTSVEELDLRGSIPNIIAGGVTPSPTEFLDSTFRILDDIDTTKKIAFQASGITTATTRELTVQDADGTIAYTNVAGGGTGATALTGVLTGNGVAAITGNAVTQYSPIIGGAANAVASVAVGTSGQVLQSKGAGVAADYSTATYPATTTVSQILYSSATNTVSGLATGNNGVLITSAAGVPSLLAAGTTGQVLTATTGAPATWGAAPAGSGWVFLDSATAAASATLDFEASIDATYNLYAFVFENISHSDLVSNRILRMQTSSDGGIAGGGSYDSGATDYNYRYLFNSANNVLFAHSSTGKSYIELAQQILATDTISGISGTLYLYSPSTVNTTKIIGSFVNYRSNSSTQVAHSFGLRTSSSIVNAVRFYLNVDNMTSGTIKMYGCCTPA